MSRFIKALSRKWTLRILSFMSQHEEARYKEIENIINNPRTCSRLLTELAKLDVIARSVSEDRTVTYSLTSRGKELVKLVDRISELESREE